MDLAEINWSNPFRHPWELIRSRFILGHIMALGARRVIDVGSGDGYIGNLMQKAGLEVLFVDSAFSAEQLSLPLHFKSINDLTVKEGDLLLLADVLEHVENPQKFLAEVLSPFAPGSPVLITVPAFNSLMSEHDVALKHFRRYSKRDLMNEVFPFVEVSKSRYFFFLPLLIRIFQKVLGKGLKGGVSQWKHPEDHWKTRLASLILKLDLYLSCMPGLSVMAIGKKR